MKAKLKRIAVYLFILLIVTGLMGVTAFAAVEKIDMVKLTFSCDPAPTAGQAPGTVTAKTTSDKFTVEDAQYTNDIDVWTLGERPEVEVTLKAAEGFRFSYTSSGKFKLSGSGSEFVRAKIQDGGSVLVLKAYLKRADGKPEEVYGLEWSGSHAMWDVSEQDIKAYEVRLYRDKKLVTTVTTTNTNYNFRSLITQSGDYTFRVRAIARYQEKTGPWSDYSEENTFSDYDAQYSGQGSWIQNQRGWWYRYHNGEYPASCWKNIKNAWYYFNQDGYMLNGWQQIDGHWYYMNGSGAMQNGWQNLGGRWYYLNGDGVMLTGWQNIKERWYYLNGDGVMLTGWQNINERRYYLNGDGVMLTGWQNINERRYYLNGEGEMLTGWQNINGRWYYLNGDGAMLTGWQNIEKRWYYLNGDGVRLTDWQNINGRWYYLNGDGVMLTGWQNINGDWYCLAENGVMYADQTTPDGYYVDSSGRRR